MAFAIREGFQKSAFDLLCFQISVIAINKWANMEVVQQALNVQQGMVGKCEEQNSTLHYKKGKNDTIYYAYDIFSSYSYHKKLSTKSCRALIFSGDNDLTFPYVDVEQWISFLNLEVEVPWEPFYVDNQVGGYLTKYALNNYSLTYATVKGAGHVVDYYKPKESFVLVMGMKTILMSQDLWDLISNRLDENDRDRTRLRDHRRKDARVLSIIQQGVDDEVFHVLQQPPCLAQPGISCRWSIMVILKFELLDYRVYDETLKQYR
ncbi:hypothetical protein E3N88_00932 [Mikania micrantha]|uniref:Peptidase S10 serine carboxypeptidase n=1 Tax=Mikania micrantha TaxID=192012 RepID=A0A5N6Q182_9ASTR|nr:hypothetical protein E3N88_00932 [Mikania micrantha]